MISKKCVMDYPWLENENKRLREKVKQLQNDLINEWNKRLEDLLCKSDK